MRRCSPWGRAGRVRDIPAEGGAGYSSGCLEVLLAPLLSATRKSNAAFLVLLLQPCLGHVGLCPSSAQQLSQPEHRGYLCCTQAGPVPQAGSACSGNSQQLALVECPITGTLLGDQCKGCWLLPANLLCSCTAGQLKQYRIWLGLLRLSLGREEKSTKGKNGHGVLYQA